MNELIKNLRIVRGYDFGADNFADVVAFDLNGSSSLEYLDDDDTLCAEHESNLRNYLPHDEADEVRERLAAWLAGPSHRVSWVSADRQGELTGWEVPHGGDVEAVKAECLREVLARCGTDEDRAGILAGTIEVTSAEAAQ